METLGRTLVIAGIALAVLGLLLTLSPSLPLGRLPGDIRIERPGLRLYLPITTCLLLSVLISAGMSLFSRLR